MIRLAVNLRRHREIRLLIVGEGNQEQSLRKAVQKKGLDNVVVHSSVDQREYLAMVSEFDIGLVSLDRRLTNHNIPGKLLAYLYWGIPVLASINPGNDLFELLEKGPAGFCIENGDDEKLYTAALTLAGDRQLRAHMGKNARALLEQTFSVESAVQQILRNVAELPGPMGAPGVYAIHEDRFERRVS